MAARIAMLRSRDRRSACQAATRYLDKGRRHRHAVGLTDDKQNAWSVDSVSQAMDLADAPQPREMPMPLCSVRA